MAQKNDFDVVIIGAGISGINAAYRLQEKCPQQTYTILETRPEIGGTWSWFKYPGIRSDSDLHTFGFAWNPWHSDHPIAEADAIKAYLEESAEQYGITKNIQFRQKCSTADWSSKAQQWKLAVTDNAGEKPVEKELRCSFIVFATGYYDYNTPLKATIPGIDDFKGQVIHPQFWPEDLDYKDKKIVIIGSGATAITLLPNLAKDASDVTMLQRSPSYVLSLPQHDPFLWLLKALLPLAWVNQFLRMKFMLQAHIFYVFCRAFPNAARGILRFQTKMQLPKGWELDPSFNPSYKPWDQRLCLCPDGDFYSAFRTYKNCHIVTDHIEKITSNSITLKNNPTIENPDIIITATGLKLQLAGGIAIKKDGERVNTSEKKAWKATMLQDIPNMFLSIGYTNASWTLGADCAAMVITRQVSHVFANQYKSATPVVQSAQEDRPFLDLNSTYVMKGMKDIPRAGDKGVWKARVNYFADMAAAKNQPITEEIVYA